MGSINSAARRRPNHGIQTMYEFGWDIGGMERSRYFGYSKDLYHFDHFLVGCSVIGDVLRNNVLEATPSECLVMNLGCPAGLLSFAGAVPERFW